MTVFHGDGASCRRMFMVLNSGWRNFQRIERSRKISSVPIWEPVDLTAVRTMSNRTLRGDRELRIASVGIREVSHTCSVRKGRDQAEVVYDVTGSPQRCWAQELKMDEGGDDPEDADTKTGGVP